MNNLEIANINGANSNSTMEVIRPQVAAHPTAVEIPQAVSTVRRPENQFAHYWGVLQDHKLPLALALLVPFGIAVAVALLQPSTYKATASLELLGVNQDFLNLRQIDPTAPLSSNSDRGDSYTQTELELLQRDVLVERVVNKLHLDQNPEFTSSKDVFTRIGELWPRDRGTQAADPNEKRRAVIRAVKRKLKVQQLRQSNIVELSFQDKDPNLCVQFVNLLAQEAVEESTRSRMEQSRNVGAWLEQHLARLREKLDSAEHELEAYTASAGLPPASDKAASEDAQLTRLQDQFGRAQTDRIHRESRYSIAKGTNPDALPEVLDDPALKEYRVHLSELRRQQAELSASLTTDHPKVQRVEAEIAALESTIAQERNNIVNRLRNEYSASQLEEKADTAALAKEASRATIVAQKEIRYTTLKRELETTRNMYDEVLKQVNDTELVSVTRASGMRVIDSATHPEKPGLSETRIFIGGIGAFTGLLLAGLCAFLLDQANDTIQVPAHMPSLFNVPMLGAIPAIEKATNNSVAVSAAPPISTMWSYHSLATSIQFALERGNDKRVIAISSPGPGEGKTTVVANLGRALAEAGHRVLLIDTDVRRPSLHKLFEVPNKKGLMNVLSDSRPVALSAKASVQRVVTNTDGSLDILTAGEIVDGPFSLIHIKRTAELLKIMRPDYDLILLDTPPLGIVPESRVVARMSDWCILVLRAGKTTVDAAMSMQQRIAEDGIPLWGTILNDCKPRYSTYGYYGYQTYGTGRLNG